VQGRQLLGFKGSIPKKSGHWPWTWYAKARKIKRKLAVEDFENILMEKGDNKY